MTPAQAFALVREKTKGAESVQRAPESGNVEDLLKLRAMKGQ